MVDRSKTRREIIDWYNGFRYKLSWTPKHNKSALLPGGKRPIRTTLEDHPNIMTIFVDQSQEERGSGQPRMALTF
jgi:hypothetical protein